MNFKQSLWDDSDPLYAPCMKKIRNGYFWVPPKKYRDQGYGIKTYKLEGAVGDGEDMARARHARALTREMVNWYEGVTEGKQPGTWAWLIARYLNDEDSDIWEVRSNTRKQYKEVTYMIERAIGSVFLAETDFTRMRAWQRVMREKGRSASYIKRWYNHLSMILSYGIKIGDAETRDDCLRIKAIRGEMRIKGGARRQVFITRQDVDLVVAEADRRGWGHLSLSLLLRFELMLRGVDVYGQWVPAENNEGGIRHHGAIWVDGMTWDMVAPDVSQITKQISKTRDSMPEPYTFDLTHLPDLRRRIMAIPMDKRTGPLIVDQSGLPPKQGMVSKRFKIITRHLGLDEALQIRDGRAGGITEAKAMVDPYTLQHAAQHQNQNTTDRYARDRSGSANKVIEMRAKR